MNDLRKGLLELHRALLDAERRSYERVHGRLSPAEFLQHLVADEQFALLRPLTTALTLLDDQLDASGAVTGDALDTLRALLGQDGAETPFRRRYAEWVETSPEVAYAHGVAQRALAQSAPPASA